MRLVMITNGITQMITKTQNLLIAASAHGTRSDRGRNMNGPGMNVCPRCNAAPGAPCVSATAGLPILVWHQERQTLTNHRPTR